MFLAKNRKYLRQILRYFSKELFMFICNFCELFLLIFILSYVLFQSVWLLLLIFAGLIGILYNIQDLFVYHPEEPPESKFYIEQPSLYNLPYEVVELVTTDSVKLHSYLMKHSTNTPNTAPTIVFFHGNAGNIGQRLSIANYLFHYCECNVFLVEYRGYGLSEGQACENGFYRDAEASVNHLLTRSDIDTTKIIVFGQSIGGAVVIDLATKFNQKLLALIVENTFTSLPDIGRELFGGIPGVNYLPDVCFKNQYQSVKKVKSLTLPGLFISGQADTMIPPRMMSSLYDKSNCKLKRLLKLSDGNHNNTWLSPGYFQFIAKFIQEVNAINRNFYLSPTNNDPAVSTLSSSSLNSTQIINSQIWHVNSR